MYPSRCIGKSSPPCQWRFFRESRVRLHKNDVNKLRLTWKFNRVIFDKTKTRRKVSDIFSKHARFKASEIKRNTPSRCGYRLRALNVYTIIWGKSLYSWHIVNKMILQNVIILIINYFRSIKSIKSETIYQPLEERKWKLICYD